MTSWVVADSSVFLATVIDDPHEESATALIAAWTSKNVSVAAPYLFRYEVMSVIRKHVARETLTANEGREALRGLLRHPIQFFANDELLERAYELANQHNRPAGYDAIYLALAERLGCEFWTADQKLVNALGSALSWVKWIGSFTPPPAQPET